jgi:hypothetical protein
MGLHPVMLKGIKVNYKWQTEDILIGRNMFVKFLCEVHCDSPLFEVCRRIHLQV